MYTAPKRLFVNFEKDRVVDEGDPDAAFLLLPEGGVLTDEDAAAWGLTGTSALDPNRSSFEEVAERGKAVARAAAPPPVVGNAAADDAKAQKDAATKAMKAAPADKAASTPDQTTPQA